MVCNLLKHSKFEEEIDKRDWNLNVLRLKKNDLDGPYDEDVERILPLPIKKPDPLLRDKDYYFMWTSLMKTVRDPEDQIPRVAHRPVDRDFKMVLPKQREPGFVRIAKGK